MMEEIGARAVPWRESRVESGCREMRGQSWKLRSFIEEAGCLQEGQLGVGVLGSCWGKPATEENGRRTKEGQDRGVGRGPC